MTGILLIHNATELIMKHLLARKLQKHQQLIPMRVTSYLWFVRGEKKKKKKQVVGHCWGDCWAKWRKFLNGGNIIPSHIAFPPHHPARQHPKQLQKNAFPQNVTPSFFNLIIDTDRFYLF